MTSFVDRSSHIPKSQYIKKIIDKLDESIDTSNKIIALLRERQGFSSPKPENFSLPHGEPRKPAFSRYEPSGLVIPQVSRVKWGGKILYSPSGAVTNRSLSPLPPSPSFPSQRKQPKKRGKSSFDFFRSLSSSKA